MFLDNFKEPFKIINLGIRLPKVHLSLEDRKFYGIEDSDSNISILTKICRYGYLEKLKKGLIPKERAKEYGDRVKYELSVLENTDFVDYILMVFSIIRERDKKGLTKSPGRGSCSGSLICHLTGITNCDPIEHELFFERFLSANRASTTVIDGVKYLTGTLPDIDLDIPDEDRHELINFVETTYPGRFVKLSTRSTYATKALTGEACKVLFNWDKDHYEFLTKEVVPKFGKVPSPDQVRKESTLYNNFCEKNPIFTRVVTRLHECINSTSSHASAYFLSYDPLLKKMPIQYGKKLKDNGEESDEIELISTYDMYTAEALGIKVDLLGLKCLTVVGNVAKLANIDLDLIDLDDYGNIYSYLQDLQFPYGLFQISGDTAVKCVNKVKPKNLEQLSAVTSLARPGALEFVDDYADYVNNGTLKSLHPLFDDVLGSTGLKVIYQEQILSIMVKIGFSKVEAETIRRGIAKKDLKYITPLEEEAYKRSSELNIPLEATKIAFDLAKKSADYSFNKCIEKNCLVETRSGYKKLYEVQVGDEIRAYDTKTTQDIFVTVLNKFENKREVYEVETESGHKIQTSIDHKYLCHDGKMRQLTDIIIRDYSLCVQGNSMIISKIKSITKLDVKNTVDLEVDHPDHNFYCNGIIVSNSHATSYSKLTALTVYLKYKYPLYFFLESIKNAFKGQDPFYEISQIIPELPYFGIELLPPDLIKSEANFTLEGNNIRFGLGAIKSVNEKSIKNLQSFIDREKTNKFLVFQAAKESKLNISVLAALIQCGVLSSFSNDRSRLVLEAQVYSKLSDRERLYCLTNGVKYNYDLFTALKDYTNWNDGKAFKESRLNTIKRDIEPYREMYSYNKQNPKLTSYIYEKELLGFSYSHSLVSIFQPEYPELKSCENIKNNVDKGQTVHYIGHVSWMVKGKSRKTGADYVKLEVYDGSGSIICIMSGDKLARYMAQSQIPDEDDIVLIEGSKGDDCIFVNRLELQEFNIYFKTSQLNKAKKKEE